MSGIDHQEFGPPPEDSEAEFERAMAELLRDPNPLERKPGFVYEAALANLRDFVMHKAFPQDLSADTASTYAMYRAQDIMTVCRVSTREPEFDLPGCPRTIDLRHGWVFEYTEDPESPENPGVIICAKGIHEKDMFRGYRIVLPTHEQPDDVLALEATDTFQMPIAIVKPYENKDREIANSINYLKILQKIIGPALPFIPDIPSVEQ